MLVLETALKSYLGADGPIVALVGDRIYPNRLKEGATLPAIAYHRISANRLYTHDSFENTDAWTTARVQFNCWAKTANEAMTVGEAVLAALSGYDGDMGGELIGSVMAANEIDDYEGATKLHRRILDFFISYEDAVTGS